MVLTSPVWHLAINSLAAKKGRTLLLILTVALATMLGGMLAVTTRSMEASILGGIDRLIGYADQRIVPQRSGGEVPMELIETIEALPQVRAVWPFLKVSRTIGSPVTGETVSVTAEGLVPERHGATYEAVLRGGRLPEAPGEATVDEIVRERLELDIGDEITVAGGLEDSLTVVGFIARPPIGAMPRQVILVTFEQARAMSRYPDSVSRLDLMLEEGVDAEAFAERHAGVLPADVKFQTPVAARAGVQKMMRGLRWSFLAAMVLVYLCAAYIVLTGLTTAVTERVRELGILRCIGASRVQIALMQLGTGLTIALIGAPLGLPLGVLGAEILQSQVPEFFGELTVVEPRDLAIAFAAAAGAGLLGAVYPAFLAARTQPLEALAQRARKPSGRAVWICLILAAVMLAVAPLNLLIDREAERSFWTHTFAGMPLTFLGFVMLCVPVLALVVRFVVPVIAWVLVLPVELVRGTIRATPLRHAFTSAGLMVGLTLLIATWAIGRGTMGTFADGVQMPEIFAYSMFRQITPQQVEQIRDLPGIEHVCPSAQRPVRLLDARFRFGVEGITPEQTSFLTFQPRCFFQVAELEWVRGDQRSALEMLDEGGAILVSREYHIAHGADVGDVIELASYRTGADGQPIPVPFRIAGVVSNRGMDLAVSAKGFQGTFEDASIAFVFGTEADAREHFNLRGYNMLMISVTPGADVEQVRQQVVEAAPVDAISGAAIIERVHELADQTMLASSLLAIASLLIACAGVSNLVAAEVSARRFEFGVMRAIGSSKGMLARLIVAQTVTIALVGCICGSIAGMQISMLRQVQLERLLGLDYATPVPWDVVLLGSGVVILIATAAALPPLWRLMRQSPRALLASNLA